MGLVWGMTCGPFLHALTVTYLGKQGSVPIQIPAYRKFADDWNWVGWFLLHVLMHRTLSIVDVDPLQSSMVWDDLM
jgi:hypothetical protein